MFAPLLVSLALGMSGLTSIDRPLNEGPTLLIREEGHKHGKDEIHKLGRKPIGSFVVSVIMIGEVEAGSKAKFDIKLIDPKSSPKALRVWIGKEDAKAEEKVVATKGEKTYQVEAPAPSDLAKDAVVWVEVESETGTARASYVLEQHNHKH